MKISSLLLAGCTIFACTGLKTTHSPYSYLARVETNSTTNGAYSSPAKSGTSSKPVKAGDYLAARFAQQHHDWEKASLYLDDLMNNGITELPVLRRAMILAMGSGNTDKALEFAKKIIAKEPDGKNGVAQVFLIMDAFDKDQPQKAAKLVRKIPKDEMSDFIKPLLEGWAMAGLGKLQISGLNDNSLQLYHAALIADYLKQPRQVKKILKRLGSLEGIGATELERIGDIYAHLGMSDKALEIYNIAEKEWKGDKKIEEKIRLIKQGKAQEIFQSVKSPKQGVALAFYDIAKILYQEYSDESARVFAAMSRHLYPELTESSFLLAYIATRHERYKEAIKYYKLVPSDDPYYNDAVINIADAYEKLGRDEDALTILQDLVRKKHDVNAQIKIGDIMRRQENFAQAVKAYTKAEAMLGNKIPEEYWHIHYLRGMAYERTDNWEAAEKDLLAALKYKPNHPYILNYLGYAWADRDMNLNRALEMVQKAVSLRPSDGYITDSLGWVLYRMGKYKAAVPELEAAVRLEPYDPIINDHLGDAYWQVGRKLEARFQWERAKNYSEDKKFIKQVSQKLEHGISDKPSIIGANIDDKKKIKLK